MPKIFRSFFSDRYNGKHERFYDRYEALCRMVPNMPPMPRPEPIESIDKEVRPRVSSRGSNTTYHYGSGSPNTDWRTSDDLSIVTRRQLEEHVGQLMPLQPIDEEGATEFSHTIWKMELPGQRRHREKSKDGVKIGYIQVVAKEHKWETAKENESTPPLANFQRYSHKKNHTAEVSFMCPEQECHMKFDNRFELRSHQRLNGHHNWEYQCVHCQMYFKRVNYLNRHKTVCLSPVTDNTIAKEK